MKYAITYLKEVTQVVDAISLEAAGFIAARTVYREEDTKVLAIREIKEGDPINPPKNPTPFDRPPSGTPGAGQMRFAAAA